MGKGGGSGTGAGHGAGQGSGDGSGDYKGKTERVAVPAMPMPMAVVCCVLNFLIPGLGTIVAGFSNFCCSRNEDIDSSARIVSCCANFGIGILQLAGTLLCLLGWVWSCVWGVFFIGMSAEYYHNNRVDDTDGRQGTVVAYQNHVIIGQPISPNTTVILQPPGPRFGPPVTQISSSVHMIGHMPMAGPSYVQQTTFQSSSHMGAPPPYDAPPPYPGPPQEAYPDGQTLYPPPPPAFNSDGSTQKVHI